MEVWVQDEAAAFWCAAGAAARENLAQTAAWRIAGAAAMLLPESGHLVVTCLFVCCLQAELIGSRTASHAMAGAFYARCPSPFMQGCSSCCSADRKCMCGWCVCIARRAACHCINSMCALCLHVGKAGNACMCEYLDNVNTRLPDSHTFRGFNLVTTITAVWCLTPKVL